MSERQEYPHLDDFADSFLVKCTPRPDDQPLHAAYRQRAEADDASASGEKTIVGRNNQAPSS